MFQLHERKREDIAKIQIFNTVIYIDIHRCTHLYTYMCKYVFMQNIRVLEKINQLFSSRRKNE